MKQITTIVVVLVAAIFTCLPTNTTAQVAVNLDGSAPNSKAMLDVSSTTMGLLIPRMTTTQRNTFEATLSATEKGMLIFDTDENAVFYFNGSAFEKLSNGVVSLLQDSDGDTKVDVERSGDCDEVSIQIDGVEKYRFEKDRISVFDDNARIAIGEGALNANPYGINIAIGDSALCNNGNTWFDPETSYGNIAVGFKAMYSNQLGTRNTAIGNFAMRASVEGSHNTVMGYEAFGEGFGSCNTAIGNFTLKNNESSYNTGVGYSSLQTNTTGSYNNAFGVLSLAHNTTGNFNIAVGHSTMLNNSTGSSNIAIGYRALLFNNVQSNNIAIGDSALYNNGYGISEAGFGEENTAVGNSALFSNTSGYKNVAIGTHALYSNTNTNWNTAVGYEALISNNGYSNTALGYKSLYDNTTGNHNFASGTSALANNTSGSWNVAVGSNALITLTTGNTNIAVGTAAGSNLTTGSHNINIGYYNYANGIDAENTLNIGNYIFGTGFDGIFSDISDGKVGIGIRDPQERLDVEEAIQVYNNSGNALLYLNGTSGSNMISFKNNGIQKATIGHNTTNDYLYFWHGGHSMYLKNGKLGIGTNDPSETLDIEESIQVFNTNDQAMIKINGGVDEYNQLMFYENNTFKARIGYSPENCLFLYEDGYVVVRDGEMGIADMSPNRALDIGNPGDGTSAIANYWYTYSDITWKRDITNISNPIEKLKKINGSYYFWKEGEDKSRQIGVIAQEIEEVLPEIVSTDEDGYMAVDYSKLTPLLIEAIKEQQNHIERLEKRIEELEK